MSWLAAERGAFSASEVARKLQMPRTTAFRVLRTLCGEAAVALAITATTLRFAKRMIPSVAQGNTRGRGALQGVEPAAGGRMS